MSSPDRAPARWLSWAALLLVALAVSGTTARGDAVEDALSQAIGTVITLSSGPGLDSASYRFGRDRVDLNKVEVKVPLPIELGRPFLGDPFVPPTAAERDDRDAERDGEDARALLQPVLGVSAGYVVAEDRPDTSLARAALGDAWVELSTFSVGASAGLLVRPAAWLLLEPRASVVESRTVARAAGRDPGRLVLKAFTPTLVGWRVEALTGIFELDVAARIPLGPLVLGPRARVALFRTWSFSTTLREQRTRSTSTVMRCGLDVEAPLFGLAVAGRPLFASVGGTLIHYEGDAGANLDYRSLYAVQASLLVDVTGQLPMVTRMGIGGEYIRGQGVEGWSLSVAWKVGF